MIAVRNPSHASHSASDSASASGIITTHDDANVIRVASLPVAGPGRAGNEFKLLLKLRLCQSESQRVNLKPIWGPDGLDCERS